MVRGRNDDARPGINAPILSVTDDTHGVLAKLDDAFLLQLLHGLDDVHAAFKGYLHKSKCPYREILCNGM